MSAITRGTAITRRTIPDHRDASAWAGKGADDLGLKGPVDPDVFTAILEGRVPDGPQLGRRGKDGEIVHRPGRDLTLSAPKSVSLAALVGGDARVADAHGRAVKRTLDWVERNAIETRMKDPDGQRMIRAGDQKAVIATFTHETSRNLDPQLHTHAVIANMVQGEDGKWRTMANEKLYSSKMLIGALYRGELARELTSLGYGIEKTHADGRFEIAGVSREIIDAFSTRRAEIEAAMEGRGLGSTAENQHLARRAALMTRAHKRDVDKEALAEDMGQTGRGPRLRREGPCRGGNGAGPGRGRTGTQRGQGTGQGRTGAATGGSVRACGAGRPRARGGGLGARASLRARRGVWRNRPARGRAGSQPGFRVDRGHRADGGRFQAGGAAARRSGLRREVTGSPPTRRWPRNAKRSR